MTKLHGRETLFHGTAVVYARAGTNRSHAGFNRFVEEMSSILLILFRLLCFRFAWTLITSTPGLELIVCIAEQPIYPHKVPRPLVHSFA